MIYYSISSSPMSLFSNFPLPAHFLICSQSDHVNMEIRMHATSMLKTHHHLYQALRAQSELLILVHQLCMTWPCHPLLMHVLLSPPQSLCLCPLLCGPWPVPSLRPCVCPYLSLEVFLYLCIGWLSPPPAPALCPIPAYFFPNTNSNYNYFTCSF